MDLPLPLTDSYLPLMVDGNFFSFYIVMVKMGFANFQATLKRILMNKTNFPLLVLSSNMSSLTRVEKFQIWKVLGLD